MRKSLPFVLLLLFGAQTVFSKGYHYINLSNKTTKSEVKSNNFSGLRMLFTLDGISGKDIVSKNGKSFTELYFGDGYYTGEVGNPKMPAFKRLIQIPFGAQVEVNVINYSKKQVSLKEAGINNPIYPVQPSLRKDKTLDDIPFEYNQKAYTKKGFIHKDIANVEVLGTMRGVRIARIEVAPVQYNPVNNDIIIYNDIQVEIVFKGADKARTQTIYQSTYTPYFEPAYSALANPYAKSVFDDHSELTSYPVHMLIISDRMFEETLKPYVEWKTKKGFYVEVAYTDDIGSSSTNIKDYVHAAYNNATEKNPAPTFLVIAGDVQQVPASEMGSSSEKFTDLYYASVDGDYFPEMYYGRLSAQTTQQLENILSKILYYEKYQFEDATYLDNVTLIAGVDGTWNPRVGEPTIKYGTKYYFNTSNGFNTVWGYGISTDPNNPNNNSGYAGCYDQERFAVSFINYSAHCNQTSWGDPQLSVSDINSLNNFGKYPLSIGNCCLSAEFGTNECVGEAWIRAKNKGAVTYIGSSPNSYWYEDFYWAVGAFPISNSNSGYVPTYEETTFGAYDAPHRSHYVTVGAMVFVGNLAVTEVDLEGYASHSSPLYYWQAYNILGDPSLTPYFTQGHSHDVSHSETLPIGHNYYQVNAAPGSYVAISKDGILHGAAHIDETGQVEVPIKPVLQGGNIDIVVTRHQTIPYTAQVPATSLESPHIFLNEYSINDEEGNSNGLVDYGEEFALNVTLKNVGADKAHDVSATVQGNDDYITLITTNPVSFGDISADEGNNTMSNNNAFRFSVSNFVPDQHETNFVLSITDGKNTWESNLRLQANAPNLSLTVSNIIDHPKDIQISSEPLVFIDRGENYRYNIELENLKGDKNGALDPTEYADIIIDLENNGKADLHEAIVQVSTSSEYLSIFKDTAKVSEIKSGRKLPVKFSLEVHEETPMGSIIDLFVDILYAGNREQQTISLPIGLQIEDFETGTFDAFPWQLTDNENWSIQESEVYEGFYAAGTDSISHNESATLEIILDVIKDSEISFYKKVSSEKDWDLLKFYIDDEIIDEWSGNVPWQRSVHSVDGGKRKFSWKYEKDASFSDGKDAAWLDYIVLPPISKMNKGSIYFSPVQIPDWLSLTENDDGTATLIGTAPNKFALEEVIVSASIKDTVVEQSFTIQVGSLSPISELNIENNVYPNPFNKYIYITNAETLNNLKIFDAVGKVVVEQACNESKIVIDTATLPVGIYIIVLYTDDSYITRKMIKN